MKEQIEDRYTIYVKEELGVIVAKTSQPPVVLSMNEGNMTASFWDFMKNIIDESADVNQHNKAAIAALQAYVKRLSN